MLVFVLLCALGVTRAQMPIAWQVKTTEGTIEGQLNENFYAFYGIPYAGNTDGVNRFMPPTPPARYSGLFNATQSNIICAQPTESGIIGVENCLTLNIFTSKTTEKKPVLVWINAEEYTTSTQSISFKRFVENGAVAVSVNFRLSIFGFLCLRVPEAPGNVGIKDVIQALKWIKHNIAEFGGNPDNVILMGHGSAAAMVDIIINSAPGTNLVQKAVTLSGSALAPWAVAYDPIGYAYMFGAKLNYTNRNITELANLFVSTDLKTFGSALNGYKFFNNTPLFAPCIESTELKDAVLTESPLKTLKAGTFNHIPYMAIYASKEGTVRVNEALNYGWLQKMQENFTNFLPVDLDFGSNETVQKEINNIKQVYFKNKTIDENAINEFLDYQGDTLVAVPAIIGAKERALKSKDKVWLCEFNYKGDPTSLTLHGKNVIVEGVEHGGILKYLFKVKTIDNKPILNDIVTFVVDTGMSTKLWAPITKDLFNYRHVSGDPTKVTEATAADPKLDKMMLWNRIYSIYYKNNNLFPNNKNETNLPVKGSATRSVLTIILVIFSVIICE